MARFHGGLLYENSFNETLALYIANSGFEKQFIEIAQSHKNRVAEMEKTLGDMKPEWAGDKN